MNQEERLTFNLEFSVMAAIDYFSEKCHGEDRETWAITQKIVHLVQFLTRARIPWS